MVIFRTDFKDKYIEEDIDIRTFPYNIEFLRLEKHLIKDMAFVVYTIQYQIGRFY